MKHTIPALTGVRYLAALLIVMVHLTEGRHITPMIDGLIHEMNIGVTIFFVLSGFLISFRYFEDYVTNPSWERSYVVNRIARIYPMYFLVTCFTFLVVFKTTRDHSDLLKTFLLNITFLRGFSQKYVYSGVAQGWTLTVEETFYLLAPFIFFLTRKVPPFLLSVILALAGLVLFCLTGLMNLKFMFICTFFGRSFEFMCGIYLYLIIKNNSFKPKIRLTLIATCIFLALIFVMSRLSYPRYEYGIQNPIGLILNNCIMPVSIAAVFWCLINEDSVFQRLLSTKTFEVLGKSSYTLYLIHYGVIPYLVTHYVTGNLFMVYVFLQLLAILGWKFVEEPLKTLVKTVLNPPKGMSTEIPVV